MTPTITRILRPAMLVAALVGLSACANVNSVAETVPVEQTVRFDPVERLAPVESSVVSPEVLDQSASSFAGGYKVVSVNVSVPETLRVNEANRYYPGGDIVWREDPIGNRHQQVKDIVANALLQGVAQIDGAREVVLDVEVSKFHALTEKARYTIGGVHAIQFTMQIRDAETGVVIAGPKFIKADFYALGGQAAIRTEARGITQKVRITEHLAHVIQQELTQAEGFTERRTGILGAINQL